jgi:hypothetical protein
VAPLRQPVVPDELLAVAEDLLDALSQPSLVAAVVVLALLLVLRLLLGS